MRLVFLALSLLSVGCVFTREWESRFAREFRLSEIHAYTPRHKIPVRFPSWMDDKDKPNVLDAVDAYCDLVCELDPWARDNFPFREHTVWIHDKVGAFVVGEHPEKALWAKGWAIGAVCVVSWTFEMDSIGRPVGVGEEDPLPALVHEWYHHIFDMRYGWADPGHSVHFPFSSLVLLKCRLNAPRVVLSVKSMLAALRYRYVPWVIPRTG